jgi:uncharacterized membrane protein YhaH (DUF805 family)
MANFNFVSILTFCDHFAQEFGYKRLKEQEPLKMFDIFEQPWLLIGVAIIVLIVMLIVRRSSPEKCPWWQWLVPLLLGVGGVGLDRFVQTDHEKINTIINTGIKAAEEENARAIDAIIAPDYRDSYHLTKQQLMNYCHSLFSEPLVAENTKIGLLLAITPPTADATLTVITRFDPRSHYYEYRRAMWIKVELNFRKQPDKSWLINRAEVREIDKQPVHWRDIH